MKKSKIIIEHADPERDSTDIAKLINLCRENRWTVLNEFTAEEESEYLRNMGSREAVFVATINNEFAGFSGLAPRFSYSDKMLHCAEGGTWVLPDHWSKGVGKTLWLEGNFPFGKRVGFRHYGHFVPINNKRAIRHYEKLGFRACGYHRRFIQWSPEEFEDAVEMELWL